jgi:hypothetical protein
VDLGVVKTADDMADRENWIGGFYELSLVLGAVEDGTLDRAVRALWRSAGVHGCRVSGASGFLDVEPGVSALREHGHLRGTLVLPSGDRVVCGGFSSRYKGSDQLELYLPLGALFRADPRVGGYPFDEPSGVESLSWRAPLDRWLADVAVVVHAEVPFQRALIGFEIEENVDIVADRRSVAVLLPFSGGWDYRPATA